MLEQLDMMRTLLLRAGIQQAEFEELCDADVDEFEDDIDTLYTFYWKKAYKEYVSPVMTTPDKADAYWANSDLLAVPNPTRTRLDRKLRELNKETLYIIRQVRKFNK